MRTGGRRRRKTERRRSRRRNKRIKEETEMKEKTEKRKKKKKTQENWEMQDLCAIPIGIFLYRFLEQFIIRDRCVCKKRKGMKQRSERTEEI